MKKDFINYLKLNCLSLILFFNFILMNAFLFQSKLFAVGEGCTFIYDGATTDNSPSPCDNGDVYIIPGTSETYNLIKLSIANSSSLDYVSINFMNALNSTIEDLVIKSQVKYINFSFTSMKGFSLGLNNDNSYKYNVDSLIIDDSSIIIKSSNSNAIDAFSANYVEISKNSVLTLSFMNDIYLKDINLRASENRGTLILGENVDTVTIYNGYLDTLEELIAGSSNVVVQNQLSVLHLNVENLTLENNAKINILSTNTTATTITSDGNNVINVSSDGIVKLDIIGSNANALNTNIIYLSGGIIAENDLVANELFGLNGQLYIGSGTGNTDDNGYNVNKAELDVFEAGGITTLTTDQSLKVHNSLKIESLVFSGTNNSLTLDGATGTINIIENNTTSGNIILQNDANLTVNKISNGLNSITLYDSNFNHKGINDNVKINNIKMVNSFFNSLSTLQVLSDLYIENSTLSVYDLTVYNNVHIVLGKNNLSQSGAVFTTNSLKLSDITLDVSFDSTSNILAGKTTTYYIVNSSTAIDVGVNAPQVIPINLPPWMTYKSINVGGNNNQINLEITRESTYEELVKGSSGYKDDTNTQIVAQNIDYIMSQGYITNEMDALITSLDLNTNGSDEILSTNIASLVPVQSIIYVSGIDAINTSTIGIVSSNLLEKNYFDKRSKVWTDFEVSNRNGNGLNSYDENSWVMEAGYNLYFAKYFNIVLSSGISKSFLNSSTLEATYDGFNFAVGAGFLSDNNFYVNIIGLFSSYDSNNTRTDYIGNAATSSVKYDSQTLQIKVGKDFLFAEENLKLNNYIFFNSGKVDAPAYVESGVLAYDYKAVSSTISEYGYTIGLTRFYDLSINKNVDTSQKIDLKSLKNYISKDEKKLLVSANVSLSSKSYKSSDTIVKFLGYDDNYLMTFAQESSKVTVISPDLSMVYIIDDYTIELVYTYVKAFDTYSDSRLKFDLKYKF